MSERSQPLYYRLEEWFTTSDPYKPARSFGNLFLVGKIYGDPRFPDGTQIQSSSVEAAKGRDVLTAEGTTLSLGEPEAAFVAWCKANAIPFDPDNPIRFLAPDQDPSWPGGIQAPLAVE